MKLLPVFIRKRIEHRPNLLKIIENIGWLFFDKILRMGVGLVVGIWIARYLGPEQFGLLSFAIALTGVFGVIAALGLQGIVVRDIVREPASKKVTLGTAAVLQFVGGLLAYGLTLGTIFWLRPDDVPSKTLVAVLGTMMLFKASDVAVYWFESQVLSKYTVWVKNSCFLVIAVIKVVLILQNATLIAFAWVMVIEALVVAVLMGLMFVLRGDLKLGHLHFTLARAKGLLGDSWPLLLSGISVVIYMKIDQIMLGQMLGDKAVGIYSVAVRISEIWYFIPMTIAASVFPAILEAKKRCEQQYYERLQSLFDLMSLISIPIAIVMTFLSPVVVDLLFGSEYAESASVLAIHVWASVFVFLGVVSGKWFLAEDLQKHMFIRSLMNGLINIFLNLLLIPEYGADGAAVALVASQSAGMLVYDHFRMDTKKLFYMKLSSLNIFRTMYNQLRGRSSC